MRGEQAEAEGKGGCQGTGRGGRGRMASARLGAGRPAHLGGRRWLALVPRRGKQEAAPGNPAPPLSVGSAAPRARLSPPLAVPGRGAGRSSAWGRPGAALRWGRRGGHRAAFRLAPGAGSWVRPPLFLLEARCAGTHLTAVFLVSSAAGGRDGGVNLCEMCSSKSRICGLREDRRGLWPLPQGGQAEPRTAPAEGDRVHTGTPSWTVQAQVRRRSWPLGSRGWTHEQGMAS